MANVEYLVMLKEQQMTGREPAAQFHRDPLLFLDRELSTGGDAVWLPDGSCASASRRRPWPS